MRATSDTEIRTLIVERAREYRQSAARALRAAGGRLTRDHGRQPRTGYGVRIREIDSSRRPRERLARDGASSLSDHELLALILRSGSSQGSALELAQALLARFVSLRGLSDATIDELTSVHGVGLAKAAEIKAALELARRLQIEAVDERPAIESPADAARVLASHLSGASDERLVVVLLDTRHRVLRVRQVAQGAVNAVNARMADLFREAVRDGCTALLLAHNHPSGDPTPSGEDVALTRRAAEAGKLLGIKVLGPHRHRPRRRRLREPAGDPAMSGSPPTGPLPTVRRP